MKVFLILAFVAVAFAATKEDLLKDAGALRKQAADAIAKLKTEGKHVEAAGIKILDDELIKVEHQLEALHPHTEAGKVIQHSLETVLKGLEGRLAAKLKALGGAFYDTKEDLIKDASKLRHEAAGLIEKLKSEGKHVLAAEIEILDKELHVAEDALAKLHPDSEIGKVALHALQSIIKGLETKLENKIKSLSGAFFDTKEDLIKNAGDLRKQAADAIAKLKTEGKHVEAAGIKILDDELIKIEHQLEALHPHTEAGKVIQHSLETVLKGLEARLAAKIKALNGAFYDTKEDLIKDASKLRHEAADAIAKLKAEGKHVLAAEIQVIDSALIKLETQLESLHPTSEAGKIAQHAIETVLKSLEAKLAAKIKAMNGAFFDTKEDLIKNAGDLRKQAADAIAKLKTEGKHVEAAGIQLLDNELIKIEHQLEALHPHTEAGKIIQHSLETVLKGLEARLAAKIKALNGAFYDTKEDLIKDASKLRTEAAGLIEKLKKEGKHVEAAAIEVLDKELHVAEEALAKLHPDSEIGKVALHALTSIIKGLETKLENKIKELSGAFYDTKEDLIKDASALRKQAADAIAKLKKEGKHTEAAGLQILDNELIKIEHQLEGLHPQTEAGKVLQHSLETVLKGLEAKLAAKIKSIGA